MNIPAPPGDRAPSPAPHPAREISARLDGLLATLLLWADRLGILRPLVARQVNVMAGLLRALSALFTRLADGGFAVPPAPAAAPGRPALPAPIPSLAPLAAPSSRIRAEPGARLRASARRVPPARAHAAVVPAAPRHTPVRHPRALCTPLPHPLHRADRPGTQVSAILAP